ncbi:hypothetical protein NMG60_11035564 [Bertholletia excelsa]
MGSVDDIERRDLYKALLVEDEDKVLNLCKKFREGPLHEITIHGDTVLHVATYTKKGDLIRKLLKMVSEETRCKMITQNRVGNTILHEAATSDKLVPMAREMISIEPRLLSIKNKFEETPIYRAARFGKTQMFKFLDDQVVGDQEVSDKIRAFYEKKGTTVLHTTVAKEEFGGCASLVFLFCSFLFLFLFLFFFSFVALINFFV